MTHRADEILSTLAESFSTRAAVSGWKVFKHRRESLSEQQDELPAYSFDFGEDAPSESQPLRGINSQLNVVATAVVSKPTEAEVRELLLEMREASDTIFDEAMHGARFGLTFVYGIGYGGASAPEIDASGETIVGSLSFTWVFGYRLR